MPDLHIRDVPQEVLDALKQRAESNQRSLQEELLAIIESATLIRPVRIPDAAKREAAYRAAKAISDRLAASGRDFGDSVQDLREDRER